MAVTNLSKRNRANKRRGSKFEADIRAFLRGRGHDAQRLARNGKYDVGDLVVYATDDHHFVIEAKDVSVPKLAQWVSEAQVEADNYAKHNGLPRHMVHWVVVWKARGKGIEHSYVVTSLDEWEQAL